MHNSRQLRSETHGVSLPQRLPSNLELLVFRSPELEKLLDAFSKFEYGNMEAEFQGSVKEFLGMLQDGWKSSVKNTFALFEKEVNKGLACCLAPSEHAGPWTWSWMHLSVMSRSVSGSAK